MYHCWNCGKAVKPRSNPRGKHTAGKCTNCGAIISFMGKPVARNNSIKQGNSTILRRVFG